MAAQDSAACKTAPQQVAATSAAVAGGRRKFGADFEFVLSSVRKLSTSANNNNNSNKLAAAPNKQQRNEQQATSQAQRLKNSLLFATKPSKLLVAPERKNTQTHAKAPLKQSQVKAPNYDDDNDNDDDDTRLNRAELSAELCRKLSARRKSIAQQQSERIERLSAAFAAAASPPLQQQQRTRRQAVNAQPASSWRDKSTLILRVDNSATATKPSFGAANCVPTFGSVAQRVVVAGHSVESSPAFASDSTAAASSLSSLASSSASLQRLVSRGELHTPPKQQHSQQVSFPILSSRQIGLSNQASLPKRRSQSTTPAPQARSASLPRVSSGGDSSRRHTQHTPPANQRTSRSATPTSAMRRYHNPTAALATPRRWPSFNYGSNPALVGAGGGGGGGGGNAAAGGTLSRRPASAAPNYTYGHRPRKSPSMNSLAPPALYGEQSSAAEHAAYVDYHLAGDPYAPQPPLLAPYARLAATSKSSQALAAAPLHDEHMYFAGGEFAEPRRADFYAPLVSPPVSPPHYGPYSSARPLYLSSRFAAAPTTTTSGATRKSRDSASSSAAMRRLAGGAQQATRALQAVHLHPQWAFSRPFAHLRAPDEDDYETDPEALDEEARRRRRRRRRRAGLVDATHAGDNAADDDDDDDDDDENGNLYDDYDDDDALSINAEPPLRLKRPNFAPYNRFEDSNVVRACDWHPSGDVYVLGSNSKTLRVCAYPAEAELWHFAPGTPTMGGGTMGGGQSKTASGSSQAGVGPAGGSTTTTTTTAATMAEAASTSGVTGAVRAPRVLFKFLQVHRGSIYCAAFNASGSLLATGSNDQTVRYWRYNSLSHAPEGDGYRLSMHSGTVRDFCFVDDAASGSSLLLSAGGGDNKIYVTDCNSATPFQSFAGHTAMVMSLAQWGGATFVSGSQDKTIRFWDLRTRSCTSIVSAPAMGAASGLGHGGRRAGLSSSATVGPGAAVCAVKTDPSGRLLVSGHADATCMLYDVRAARVIQTFKQHDDEVRALSFSPKAYYLLTGGYDGKLMLSDLQGDLTQQLPTVCVASHADKVIQAKWHPHDFTFLTCCANKSATLWAIPRR